MFQVDFPHSKEANNLLAAHLLSHCLFVLFSFTLSFLSGQASSRFGRFSQITSFASRKMWLICLIIKGGESVQYSFESSDSCGEQSGAAEACWAHNPEVDGSKPSSAKSILFSPFS